MGLKRVLLIDDDEATNFLHELAIKKTGLAEEVIALPGGQEALDWLATEVDGAFPQPEMTFVDINMPKMDGWQFLAHYRDLDARHRGGVILVMLTTSLNPRDRERAGQFGEITDFQNKPLTSDRFRELAAQYFG